MFSETTSKLTKEDNFMKILRNEQDTNLQTIYSQEKCLKSPQSISRNRIHHKIQKSLRNQKRKQDIKMTKFEKNPQ